jgi:uncharacterized protein YndB with AHSA1/START domain
MANSNDRVEREIFMRASIDRAFAALTDPSLFPTWGPERVEGSIAVGERPLFDFGFAGKVAIYIVAIEPPRYFAYRWKQGERDPARLLGDPLEGPNTLVEFFLEEKDGGTRVRVVESGIADLPITPGVDPTVAIEHMRKGWELMISGLPRHLTFREGDTVDDVRDLAAPLTRVRELIGDPTAWWMMAPALDVIPIDERLVQYRWDTRLIAFDLQPSQSGTRLRTRITGLGDRFEAKKAHQAWGVILGMLEMALAT